MVGWHPLLAHAADVAAVTEALLTHTILGQRLAQLIGWETLGQQHIARLSALAAIHDSGKVNHGFQNKAFEIKGPREGHVSTMINILEAGREHQEQLLMPLGIHRMTEWFEDGNLLPVLNAVWAHHGKPVLPQFSFNPELWQSNELRDPVSCLNEMGQLIGQWFPEAFEDKVEPFPDRPVLQHTFNGILTLADWLGSDHRRFFPFSDGEVNHSYLELARKRASNALKTLALDPSSSRTALGSRPVTFDSISPFTPYDVQKTCMELPRFKEGGLTVMESDTGSGKTEAAVARFINLYHAGLVDGLYFAVPTRSAATQLYRRVHEAVNKAFPDPDSRPPVVQAVSGYLKVDDVEGVPLPGFDVKWDDDPHTILYERGWAAEHPKRYLAGAVVIGTIDQILLSALQVRHTHMRSSALLRHFLVIDEVHASDTYMTHLLEQALDHHMAAGGHALLMSATLGTESRLRFTAKNDEQSSPPAEEASRLGYPLLSHVSSSRKGPSELQARSSGYSKQVGTAVRPIASLPETIAETAVQYARQGAKTLIIRNLVDDCIQTQKALEQQAGSETDLLFGSDEVFAPHHARFAPEDRKVLDRAIESCFGKESVRQPVVASATQTVEQSLDIDADILITDLCPMDVLLQRIGRLHRHSRTRPEGFETAQCIVVVPEERDLGTMITESGEVKKSRHGLGSIYPDLRILEQTLRILETVKDCWHIPKDNRWLVEQSMHSVLVSAITKELGGNWPKHEEQLIGRHFADRQLSGLVSMDYSRPFGETGFSEDLKTVKTRLGRDDYQVILPKTMSTPFGNHINEMTVTEWQLARRPEDPNVPENGIHQFEGGFGFTYCDRHFTYDRFGLSVHKE